MCLALVVDFVRVLISNNRLWGLKFMHIVIAIFEVELPFGVFILGDWFRV